MIRTMKKFLRNNLGVAGIEAAFILPLMMLLFVGMIDVTGLISINRKTTYASGVMADLVTQHKTTMTKAEVEQYYDAVYMVMKPIATASIGIDTWGFRKNGAAIDKKWSTTTGGGCGTQPDTTGMADLMTATNDIIVARVCTTYTPWISKWWSGSTASWATYAVGKSTFTIKEATSPRPRSSKTLDCVTVSGGTTACS